MAASLPRPGVQVIQQFRAVSPTVITPTLVPSVVGVCKQVVELLVSDGAGGQLLNPDALVTMPAFFIAAAATGTPAVYTGLNSYTLSISVNSSPDVDITFSDPATAGLTPATVVAQINAALALQGVTSVTAILLDDDRFQLATVAKGQFESIVVASGTDTAVCSAFDIGVGQLFVGTGEYNQYDTNIPKEAFPDPRGNLSELAFEQDTVRVFLSTGSGTGVKEARRDEAFLRRGDVADQAYVQTSTDLSGLSYPTAFGTKTLLVSVDGGAVQTITFASPANAAAVVTQINAALSGALASLVGGTTLRITSNTGGYVGSVTIGSTSTILTANGGSIAFVAMTANGVSIAAVDDGNGDAFTSLLAFAGETFTTAAASAVLTGSAAPSLPPAAGTTLVISDGGQPQTITFLGTETAIAGAAPSIQATVEAVVGTAVGGRITVSAASTAVRFTNSASGDESVIKIIGGTALAALDAGGTPTIAAGAEVRGTPFPPVPGDEIWIDGVLYAKVNQVAPGGVVTRLKIDRQVVISSNVGTSFFIQAKNLVMPALATRPTPDSYVDLTNTVHVKHSILRDFVGLPVNVRAPIYLAYRAVRKDTTALAADPGLLRFDDTVQLEQALGPITAENPLGLGLFFALVNAPGVQVTGLGVDAISDDAPLGTVEAFTRAAEYLEGFEVYAIAPLTHDESVAQVFNTHVQFMSQPEQRGERIVLWNPSTPTHHLDTLVASGSSGDALSGTVFDTKITNISALLQNAGVSPVGVIPVSAGVFLDIAADGKRYSVYSVSGSQITVRSNAGDFSSGSNDDDYYAENAIPLPLVGELFSVRIRGSALTTIAGTSDKNAIAETMNALGQSFNSRRFWMTAPDRCAATIQGVEQVLDGFYMNAATVGTIGQQPPQQSFTNFPISGFTRVLGSNDTFSEHQLDVMAGGGTYIFIQDAPSAPIYARMSLTTDVTSIETRTDSVTKIVDFTAKFMRRSLKNYIGRFNISQGFLDTLGTTVQGLFGFLTETGVLIGGSLDNIIQDEDDRDTVLLDTTLDVPIPCNYLKLVLMV